MNNHLYTVPEMIRSVLAPHLEPLPNRWIEVNIIVTFYNPATANQAPDTYDIQHALAQMVEDGSVELNHRYGYTLKEWKDY
jgi:hypothetical protein